MNYEEIKARQRAAHMNPGGSVIREARLRAFLTQEELADLMGVDQSLISRWERGRRQPRFDDVVNAVSTAGFALVMEFDPQGTPRSVSHGSIRFKRDTRMHSDHELPRLMRAAKSARKELRRMRMGLPPRPPRLGPHV